MNRRRPTLREALDSSWDNVSPRVLVVLGGLGLIAALVLAASLALFEWRASVAALAVVDISISLLLLAHYRSVQRRRKRH
jgi:hypothetical protein